MADPVLSVVVLTWNEEANIAACLRSLAMQRDQRFEVVLVDAGSDDATVDIARGIRATFPVPFSIDVGERRMPIGEARNRGVALAATANVAFLSADAEIDPDWTEKALAALDDADMVFGRQVHAPHRWGLGTAVRGLRYDFPSGPVGDPLRYASNVAAAYRKDALTRQPFDPWANAAEDLLLARRSARAGRRATYDPRMVVRHHDVASARTELRKNLREGRGWALYVRELGVHWPILAWTAALLALTALCLVPSVPRLLSLPLLAATLWAPALRRALRHPRALPSRWMMAAILSSPAFDLAFAASYLAGLLARRPRAAPPHASAAKAAPNEGPRRSDRHATVFIIMDAGRADYLKPESMPFLTGLAKGGVTGSFESPPGFAQRTVLFSGRYPDTSGNFSAFVYDPDNSPFRWVRRLGPLGRFVQARRVLFPLRMAVAKVTKLLTRAYHTDPAWIPTQFLPFFRPCEDMRPVFEPGALGAPSIFDLCRDNGLRFRYLAHPVSGDDEEVHRILVRELREAAPYDLYVAQFSVTDQQGHVHGPFSDAMQNGFLRDLDAKLASVHAALVAGYRSWDLFICGDHGMAPVGRRIDLLAALREIGAKPAKDYVVFVNSTLAVFWYLTEKGRAAVEALLPTVPGAHPVGDEERARLRIPVERRWGDRMLAADPGSMFWPDYFHVTDSPIVGMHGYLDKRDETHGLMLLASNNGHTRAKEIGLRPLVDVFPTLCGLIGVPAPQGQEGTRLPIFGEGKPEAPPAPEPPTDELVVA